ncbi:hypothetical protein BX661DRAFT_224265 [Kickxella alabastrina]|uniref:uncharacterized protein n=1 Tax=Kickxella alabastrina TaxID=61397 RepID=UPI00221ED2B4|nr:uncharacterized protein BX661DRAFT_224265 [Kickxella alabastrina]KAI7829294.1 hypothetical protein BX661DRAFT_224265 [Kickxella alabastrina]
MRLRCHVSQPNPGVTAKVVKTIDVSYSGENGFNQTISLSQECLSNLLDMGIVEMVIIWENLEGTHETGTQLELINKEPPIEWIAKVYKHKGALLEFITDKSPKGLQYINGFGGIGDMLHWQLDVTQLGNDSDMYYKKGKEQANDKFDDYF